MLQFRVLEKRSIGGRPRKLDILNFEVGPFVNGNQKSKQHMLYRYLIYFLSTLIFMQSSIVMTDEHQTHQSGYEHVAFDLDNNSQVSKNTLRDVTYKAQNDQGFNNTDCKHCCHCHNFVQLYLASYFFTFTVRELTTPLSGLSHHYYSRSTSPDNPPPIV